MSSFLNPGGSNQPWGGKYDGGGYGNLPGYENPLLKDTPSWGGDYDWKGGSKGIDWGSGFDIDKSGMFEKLFDKARDTDKYRKKAESFGQGVSSRGGYGGEFGKATSGFAGEIIPGVLSGIVSPKDPPMLIPGAEGKKGLGSTIGGLVGIGASFIPGLGPGIAAAMPAIGSGVGGLFG